MTTNKQQQQTQERPHNYSIAEQFLFENYVAGKESKGEPIKTLRSWKDDFYAWKDGCYRRLSDSEIKGQMAEFLYRLDVPGTSNAVSSILISLQHQTRIGDDVTLNSWLDNVNGARVFPMANGNVSFDDIDQDTGRPRLLPHTPWYFTLSKVPYNYDPEATCPLWDAFLNDVMYPDTDCILLLQQWLAYLFGPDLKEQKFLLCTGEGSNGKSVFFDVVQSLVGERNCSHLSLFGFNPKFGQFGLQSTLGKMVNMSTESSHIIADEGETILKSYVVGDELQFERKFKDPVTTRPTAKIMIATNAPPRFNDKTNAIWRRLLIVPFQKEVKEDEQIKDLSDQLKAELPGIFNWALEGVKKLNEAGRFFIPEVSKRMLEEHRKDSDPARTFLLDCCTYSPNGEYTPCEDLYNTYVLYCKDNGCMPVNSRGFGRCVHRVYPKATHKKNGGRGDRVWVYEGLVTSQNCNLTGHGAGRANDEKPLF